MYGRLLLIMRLWTKRRVYMTIWTYRNLNGLVLRMEGDPLYDVTVRGANDHTMHRNSSAFLDVNAPILEDPDNASVDHHGSANFFEFFRSLENLCKASETMYMRNRVENIFLQ